MAVRLRRFAIKNEGTTFGGLWGIWVYFYCSELGGVSMPGFENINRQC
jgi:hypothetical protein